MSISIVIPTYHSGELIETKLKSLMNQDYQDGMIEIIIIDNNPAFRTNNHVMSFLMRRCRLVTFATQAIGKGDISLLQRSLAYIFNYSNFFSFGFRLLHNGKWRAFTLKWDPLTNDLESYNLLAESAVES